MWHLQILPPFSFCCDVALVMLAVVIVGMSSEQQMQVVAIGDGGGEMRVAVMRWVGIMKDGGGGG